MKKIDFNFDTKKALSIGSLVLGAVTLFIDHKVSSNGLKDLKSEVAKEVLEELSKKES